MAHISILDNHINLPEELKRGRIFVLCNDKKLPVNPHNPHSLASITNPDTWDTFDNCLKLLSEPSICGIWRACHKADGLVWGDIDHCRDVITGVLNTTATTVLNLVGETYTEASPSGTGIRFVCKVPSSRFRDDGGDWSLATMPGGSRTKDLELYTHARFMSLTGDFNYTDKPGEIRELDEEEVWQLYRFVGVDLKTWREGKLDPTSSEGGPWNYNVTPDLEQIQMMMAADDKFSNTWLKKRRGFEGDDSRYCSAIAVQMLDAECTDQQVIDAMIYWRRVNEAQDKNGMHGGVQGGWYLRTLEDAKQKLKQDGWVGPIPAGNSVLDEIRSAIGVPGLDKFVMVGDSSNPKYELHIAGEIHPFPDVRSITGQAAWRNVLFNIGYMMPKVSAKGWAIVVGALLKVREHKHENQYDDMFSEINRYVVLLPRRFRLFVDSASVIDESKAERDAREKEIILEKFEEKESFVDQAGVSQINTKSLWRFLIKEMDERGITKPEMFKILRDMKLSGKTIAKTVDGKILRHQYWSFKAKDVD